MSPDRMQRILERWAELRPEMDTSPMAVIGRIMRAARLLELDMGRVFESFGLNRGEFDVLASLLRAGPPHRLTPTELSAGLLISTSAMTNRVDRLEAAGLVARERDPHDRRGVLVRLTVAGRRTMDDAMETHLANEARLLDVLALDDRRRLARLLEGLLISLEGEGMEQHGDRAELNVSVDAPTPEPIR